MSKSISQKIAELEQQGYTYETNYNTGKHLLSEVLVKRWIVDETAPGGFRTDIKYIENNGKIKNYL